MSLDLMYNRNLFLAFWFKRQAEPSVTPLKRKNKFDYAYFVFMLQSFVGKWKC